MQHQKDKQKMSIDNLVDFFQICHAADQPTHKQHLCEATEKHKYKEANKEEETPNKKCITVRR